MNTIDNFAAYASPNTLDGLNAVGSVISTNALLVDGTNGMAAPLTMQNHKITGLANGVAATDAAAFGQIASATSAFLPKSGGTMTGPIAMGSQKITGLANGVAATDAATVGQLQTGGNFLPLSGGTMSGDIYLGGNWVRGSNTTTPPTADSLVSVAFSQNQINAAVGGYLNLNGGAMSGPIAMGSQKITGLANGVAASDAAAFGQIAAATSGFLPLTGGTMSGDINLGGKWIKGSNTTTPPSGDYLISLTFSQNQINAAIGGYLNLNGGTMTGPIAMGAQQITGLANGVAATDAAAFGQIASATSAFLPKSGGTMTGPIAMGSQKITGIANGTAATDAAAFGQIAAATGSYLPLSGGTMTGAIAMGSQKITGIANGTAATDAAAFGQIATATSAFLPKSGGTMTGALGTTIITPTYAATPTVTISNIGGTYTNPWNLSVSTAATTLSTFSNTAIGHYLVFITIGNSAFSNVTSVTSACNYSVTGITAVLTVSQQFTSPGGASGTTSAGTSYAGVLRVTNATNTFSFTCQLTAGTCTSVGVTTLVRIG